MATDFLNLLRLDGRGIVLLGAGQGIGAATAHALSQAGARVLCVDKEPDLATRIAHEVGGAFCVADVTQRADMVRVFKQARESFGAVRGIVDIVGMAKLAPISAFSDADYEWQLDVGLRHAFLALQIGAPLVAEGGGGAITFVGSISGIACLPNEVVYSASKAALHHLARAAALEFGPRGVRVNAIAPGFTRTPRLNKLVPEERWKAIGEGIPLGRAATPEEIAGPLLFLSSDLGAHISGAVIAIDGGLGAMAAIPPAFIATLKGK
jgi:NAD(P)-dependent dehydrogenase (short-subunit alcohol dehydrogenase family)